MVMPISVPIGPGQASWMSLPTSDLYCGRHPVLLRLLPEEDDTGFCPDLQCGTVYYPLHVSTYRECDLCHDKGGQTLRMCQEQGHKPAYLRRSVADYVKDHGYPWQAEMQRASAPKVQQGEGYVIVDGRRYEALEKALTSEPGPTPPEMERLIQQDVGVTIRPPTDEERAERAYLFEPPGGVQVEVSQAEVVGYEEVGGPTAEFSETPVVEAPPVDVPATRGTRRRKP